MFPASFRAYRFVRAFWCILGECVSPSLTFSVCLCLSPFLPSFLLSLSLPLSFSVTAYPSPAVSLPLFPPFSIAMPTAVPPRSPAEGKRSEKIRISSLVIRSAAIQADPVAARDTEYARDYRTAGTANSSPKTRTDLTGSIASGRTSVRKPRNFPHRVQINFP